MRKFLVIGATAFSAVALTLSAASPANAIPVDNGMISGLCADLPGDVVDMGLEVAAAALDVTDATADNALAQTALAASTAGLVTAVINHVVAADTDDDVSVTGPAVGTAVTDYAAKTVASGAAFDAMVDAQRSLQTITNTHAFAGGVSTGLCLPPVI